jgi:hypothetical protein
MNGALDVSLLFSCLIWVPVSISVVTLSGWIIQAEIEPLLGLLGVGVALGVGILAFVGPDPQLGPWLLLASISMVILVPIGRSLNDKRDLALIDIEQIERAYEALATSPTDVGSKFRIARVLFKRGNALQAIALAEDALKGMSKTLFEDEFRTLAGWKRGVPWTSEPMVCVCGNRNSAGAVFCTRCRAPLMLHFARGKWVHPSVFRRLLLGWMAALLSIIGIPAAASALPTPKSTGLVVALLAGSAVLGWLALRPERTEQS